MLRAEGESSSLPPTGSASASDSAPSAPQDGRPFLTASWRYLAMLNFEADPAALAGRVPPGTELDSWRGRTIVSLVAFLFEDTRVLGIRIPFHSDFEEVNLRFYVRRKAAGESRRGVVFVREIVPRRAIAWTARALYGENYSAMPMRHRIARSGLELAASYAWGRRRRENSVEVAVRGEPAPPAPGGEAEFVTEHFWGYAARRGGGTLEYRVDHPQWRIWEAASARAVCDGVSLYGQELGECLLRPPTSAFLAEGSPVSVYRGLPLERAG